MHGVAGCGPFGTTQDRAGDRGDTKISRYDHPPNLHIPDVDDTWHYI